MGAVCQASFSLDKVFATCYTTFMLIAELVLAGCLRADMFLPKPKIWLKAPACEVLLLEGDDIRGAEGCAWRIAQQRMIRRLPGFSVAILRMRPPKVEYKRRKGNGEYGKAEEKHPERVRVYLTEDAVEDVDSVQHEMQHSIIYRLIVGGLTKWGLHTWVDMSGDTWTKEGLIWPKITEK